MSPVENAILSAKSGMDGELFQFALLNTVLNLGHISPRTALTW